MVGELHDNVASHSGGYGFSAAQKLQDRLHFAIADNGVGMPTRVRDAGMTDLTDVEPVSWCLERGNTTAKSAEDPWAQRLPEDSIFNPFPDSVTTVQNDDNHMGEGLWQLRELVRNMQGNISISSGKAFLSAREHSLQSANSPYTWSGVAISFTLRVQDVGGLTSERQEALDSLSDRLGVFE